ncbi:MAG: TauD/TfdA dioxygenase family protein [Mycobacteriales bacterium]
MPVSINETASAVGVEVEGLHGNALVDETVAAECRALLDQRGVVVYREAHVDDDQLVAFSRMLGEVLPVPRGAEATHPEVDVISLDPEKSVLAAVRQGTFYWHIDGTRQSVPEKATLLTAVEVSDEGGDTEFASTYAGYEGLTDEDKAAIGDLRVVHSFTAAQLLVNPHPTAEERAAWDRVPAKEHPLVWRRKDGRRSLLIGATAGEVVGMPADEGRALLDRLLDAATQPELVLRHHWRRGDLVIWDNTGMLHRAIPYEVTSRRLMHRTTLVGEEEIV